MGTRINIPHATFDQGLIDRIMKAAALGYPTLPMVSGAAGANVLLQVILQTAMEV